MKKIIATIMFAVVVAAVCRAQESNYVPHHEVYGGIGVLNDNQGFSMLGDLLGTVLTFGQAVRPHSYWIITPSVGYRYWFNSRVGLGVHFAFDKNSVEAIHIHSASTLADDEWRVHNRYFYTVAVDFSWNYMNKPVCQLYGNVGLGATLVSFSDNKADTPDARLRQFPFFNMHLSPLGVRVGKTVAGFAEIGWGYKGIINIGISAKF